MKSTVSVKVLLSLIFITVVNEFTNAEDVSTPSVTDSPSIDERKILVECQHSDYRTYIKCLKRQKRHHWHNGHDADGGETKKCFDDCEIEQCESTKCLHDCHKHCMKKTKETRQIITQYETTCDSGECTDKSTKADLTTTNITTNIDINNVINNHMPNGSIRTPDSCPPNGPCTPGGTGCTPGLFGCNNGLNLIPQIQFVPQITFGLGINPYGGGYWPNPKPNGFDCSSCGNPFTRYRCDVSCYNVQGGETMIQNTGRTVGSDPRNCNPPQCVGGT